MYLLIIFSIITVIILYFFWKDANMRSSPRDFLDNGFKVLFLMAIAYGLSLVIGRTAYTETNNLNTYEYKDLQISSLVNKDQYGVKGVFILGTGSINGNSYSEYITYGKFQKGLKRLELSATNYYIKETDSKSPCIPKYFKISVLKPFESKWFWNRKYQRGSGFRENLDAEVIIVPTNTIYKEFSIRD